MAVVNQHEHLERFTTVRRRRSNRLVWYQVAMTVSLVSAHQRIEQLHSNVVRGS